MKTFSFIISLVVVLNFFSSCSDQLKVEWVMTTEATPWEKQVGIPTTSGNGTADIVIDVTNKKQQVDGFGACFNELGWTSLNRLSQTDRENIMKELFAPGVGANFTICRMPVGANDFSLDWYSYNETEGDFEMKNFSIANDLNTLIPFINNAKEYNPAIKVWASPWCPPSWMKYNKHYASAYTGENVDLKYRNGLPADKVGYEGTDMFIQEPRYLEAYALYFTKFIQAYKEQGIDIFAVMPQNEFNSAQVFPSCCWTAGSLANFVGKYLAPAMSAQNVDVMFGTMERPNEALVDTILNDPDCKKYIKGVGFQWAGKGAIPGIHKRYSDMKLYQTEQECGDGKNNWSYAMYTWSLMRHYMQNGTSVYTYWNISLDKGGISRWGWAQNSLVVVDPDTRSFKYTNEYYVMKHASHYVQPGANRIDTSGSYDNLLVFQNPDNSIVVIVANESEKDKNISIQVNGKTYNPLLKANSLSTLIF